MDSAEVTVCSVEDRNLGEERVHHGWKVRFVPTGVGSDLLVFGFRLQEQPAESEGSVPLSTKGHRSGQR